MGKLRRNHTYIYIRRNVLQSLQRGRQSGDKPRTSDKKVPSIREGVPTPVSKMALKVIQINVNHCESAQDLLFRMALLERVDVVIVADQYRNLDSLSWKTDAGNSATIWACGEDPVQEVMKNAEEAFARIKISVIYFYSCYMPPSMPQEEFERILD